MTPELYAQTRETSQRDRKNLVGRTLKASEEVGELAKAVLPYSGEHATNHRFVQRESIIEEVVDTMLSVLSVAYDVGATDEEIREMYAKKLQKWNRLIDADADDEYWFEVHITIKPTGNPDYFEQACRALNVKPIIICGNNSPFVDWMTSSKVKGTNQQVQEHSKQIVDYLTTCGYTVLRSKIEAAPNHPQAQLPNSNTYYETHIPVIVSGNTNITQLTDDASKHIDHPLHVSRNAFKSKGDSSSVRMITLRLGTNEVSLDEFEDVCIQLWNYLAVRVTLAKERYKIEYALYDSNVTHDDEWINER